MPMTEPTPPRDPRRSSDTATGRTANRRSKALLATMPIVLVGSLAVSLGMATPAEAAPVKRVPKAKSGPTQTKLPRVAAPTVTPAAAPTVATPSTYVVEQGDTVSGIAGRFGLSTASVLAQNGLGWKTTIFPGQTLTLGGSGASAPAPAAASSGSGASYTVVAGDTVSGIAGKHGVSTSAVLQANGLQATSTIFPGNRLTIPGAGSTAAPASPSVPASASPAAKQGLSGTYTIETGDTLHSIATESGVTVQDLLNANGLNWSSIIYAGSKLTIPHASASVVQVASLHGTTIMTDEMRRNARVIVQVGRSAGVSDYGLVIALATAAQESTLRNLDWGDRDSIGLFQQRPSQGWGQPAQLNDPVYASRAFFGGSVNPNPGATRGLLDIAGWKSMTVTQAAQAVQYSAYPDAYAKWEASAWAWLDEIG
ncbi:muramidase family protein [Clavibacter phaseoli]|uniref:muramidase family protein n=1 Tax=Clavibacter phaseoli TaxID=1734031 RepID=UPI000E66E6C4|nr:LysM peptidoglycan-binding domain-containing protein [Clavibacter phaseoli]RIJ58334.1 LysM peptidoglycan-binding domain-containing protein [Clavibacter phaseoli]UKF30335.1 LysM peptidoglycan-binding domain-containing protein [Clavibacter phaseoli]UKF36253.1 LysM peptidoglycan-binding domain-containing protein [Clavibacter phaseoli]